MEYGKEIKPTTEDTLRIWQPVYENHGLTKSITATKLQVVMRSIVIGSLDY